MLSLLPPDVSDKPGIIFIVGPTATGKSRLAVKLAEMLPAEIISLDSIQVYKGLDILSSKPSAEMRKTASHHLLDIVRPQDEFNANSYRELALKKIKEIHRKGKVPLFAGGTGLYLSLLVDGIFKEVKKDASLRKKLYRQAQAKGSLFLYDRLKAVDKEAADRIHQNDLRRIVRALEVCQLSGRPISELRRQREGIRDKYNIKIFGLNKERSKLYDDINRRVDEMFSSGMVEEVKGLLGKKLSLSCQQAIGIKEIKGYLNGEYSLDYARQMLKKNTRNYAKRQLTWFRRDKKIIWLDADDRNILKEIVRQIRRMGNG